MPANAYLPKTGLSLADLGPMIKPYQTLGTAPASTSGPSFTPQQDVRQQELADLFQQQSNNLLTTGQSVLNSALALSPQLTTVADNAYAASTAAGDLTRVTGAVDSASTARKSAVQQTLDNLKAQAKLGFDASKRSLDSQRAAYGLPTESSSFYKHLGNAYYSNYLPVEGQALAIQSQNIEADLAAEQHLKNLELAAAAQRAGAASQYAQSLAQPIGLQMDVLNSLGSGISNLAPIADRAYYNYVSGDDGLGSQVPAYNLGYSVPQVSDTSSRLIEALQRFQPAQSNYVNAPAARSVFTPEYVPAMDRAARLADARGIATPSNFRDLPGNEALNYVNRILYNQRAGIDPALYE